MTWSREPEKFPATSDAFTIIRLTPGFSEMLQENDPPVLPALTPLQRIEFTFVNELVAVPLTMMLADVETAWSAGDETDKTGGVLSILRVTLVVAKFPAVSVAVPVTI